MNSKISAPFKLHMNSFPNKFDKACRQCKRTKRNRRHKSLQKSKSHHRYTNKRPNLPFCALSDRFSTATVEYKQLCCEKRCSTVDNGTNLGRASTETNKIKIMATTKKFHQKNLTSASQIGNEN